MTTRERVLATILLPLLLLVGGGYMAYQLWYEPMRSRDLRAIDLQREIDEKHEQVRQIRERKKEMEKYRLISLPADVDLARREYEEELSKLIRKAGFDAGLFSIIPKPADTKTSPTQATKKPIYTRLLFTVQAKGELLSFVEFLESFYSIRLLHQVRNISIQRPVTSDRGRGNELEFNFTIEALVLDNAEHRKTLLPENPPELPPINATEPRTYKSIAGRDIFFGPAPVSEPTRRSSGIDFAQFIKFDSYTVGDKGPIATLFDAYHNQEVLIRPASEGEGYRVDVTFLLNGRRRSLRSGKTIDIIDEDGELQHRWLVLRVDDREILLQDEDHYYSLHIGTRLSEMVRLSAEETAARGLTAAKPVVGEDKAK